MEAKVCVGLMSGTSMDGIDANLLKTDGETVVQSLASAFYPYSNSFKFLLKSAEELIYQCKGDFSKACGLWINPDVHTLDSELISLLEICNLNSISLENLIFLSTYLHHKAVIDLCDSQNYSPDNIEVIGYHGQTLYHAPQQKKSLQLGNSQWLANQLKRPVAADFRSNDINAGGQGAPLAPLYHWALCTQTGIMPTAILNCGGIANITLIPNENPEELIAFDTGPGNVLLDRFVRYKTDQSFFYDYGGHWGMAGIVDHFALEKLFEESLSYNFLEKIPPKSLDSHDCKLPEFILQLSLQNGCATLAAFSAELMVRSLSFFPIIPTYWVLAGGGWYNAAILMQFKERLESRLKKSPQIFTASQLGWENDMIEAQAFAYLAKRVLKKLPISFPKTTGVKKPLTGGKIFYPEND